MTIARLILLGPPRAHPRTTEDVDTTPKPRYTPSAIVCG